MKGAVTFSELFTSSFRASKVLFWTYARAQLILISFIVILACIRFLLSIPLSQPSMAMNTGLTVTIWTFIAVIFVLQFGCQILSGVTSLVIAIDRTSNAWLSIKRSVPYILKVLYLSGWILLRSFVWISALGLLLIALQTSQQGVTLFGWLLVATGIVTAIVLGPRFWFAPILLIRDKMSVHASARECYRKTARYWGKIMGNLLILSLIIGGVFLGMCLIFGGVMGVLVLTYQSNSAAGVAIGIPLILVFAFVALGVFFFVQLFQQLFFVDLFATIENNPR